MSAPPPPTDLASRGPEFVIVDAGVQIERFHDRRFDPLHFDRGRLGRLNAPDGHFGVLYAAADLRGAFAETFLRTPGRTLLPFDLIARKSRARLRVTRAIKLLKLGGFGLARVGATAEVTHAGLPYDVAQNWSKAIHDLPSSPDGVAYYARHDDEALCYALFDRAAPFIVVASQDYDLDQPWFWELAERYRVGLAPPSR